MQGLGGGSALRGQEEAVGDEFIQQPATTLAGGRIRITAVKHMKAAHIHALPGAQIERADERTPQDFLTAGEVAAGSQDAGHLGAISLLLTKCAGVFERDDDGGGLVWMTLDKCFRGEQDFFSMTGRKLLAGSGDPTDATRHRLGVPRFTDTATVNQSSGEIPTHLRGWQHDDAHVFVGINAA